MKLIISALLYLVLTFFKKLPAMLIALKTQTLTTIFEVVNIYDLLVWRSQFLLASTFMERQKLLDSKLKTNVETATHYVCDNEGKIWYAKLFTKDFKKLFKSIKDTKIDEGLVLKDPDGKLQSCRTITENTGWQVKCRHKHKNYAF